ncbi:BatA domain-containing protein [Paraflavitalea pollutisoli]|uniref:BatA domain-containing protein n=1 Tax=Paraflavitalea pollutisoli TaxID=3034143 RepID=UPI0023EAED27|nr:BatA domain-containing protein [Paraflavitalea sp. H1-2-19X]
MLQLLNPIGLLAATAVLIPVLVHLWRERIGKTLRIGSIRLLANSNRTQSNSLRIYNWPLFLLRCLLVLLLALLLAKPVWQQQPKAGVQQGWILIPQSERRLAYTQYKTTIDSLLAAKWELHDLGTGFRTFNISEPIAPPSQSEYKGAGSPRIYLAGETETAAISTWSLMKELDSRLPAGYAVQVFTSNRLAQYEGTRPATSLSLRWHSYLPADSSITTNMAAWIGPKQAIKTLVQTATPAALQYAVTTANTLPQDIEVDTALYRIAIYPGANTADARYLKAALQAIGDVSELRFDISTLSTGQLPAAPQQLIIQLNATPALPLDALSPGGKLLKYDTGKLVSHASWQQADGLVSLGTSMQRTYSYIPGQQVGRPLWTLANGQPLLTVQDTAGKQVFRFKAQFNPAAGDLVWSGDFAQQLLPLVLATPATTSDNDIRSIDDRQAMPTTSTTPRPLNRADMTTNNANDQTDLSTLIGMLVILTLAAERLLVYRQQNKLHHA